MSEAPHTRSARGFSRLAGIYDLFAALGTFAAIGRSQRDHWNCLPKGRRVLVVGGGTGRFLPDFLCAVQPVSLTFVEPSEAMRRRAQRRLKQMQDRVQWHSGALPDALPEGEFDLILLPFVLDLFDAPGLRASLEALNQRLDKGGQVLFYDFRMPPRGIARLWAKLQIGLLYRFFRVLCSIQARSLPDFDSAFAAAGWETAAERRRFGGLIQSRLLRRNAANE